MKKKFGEEMRIKIKISQFLIEHQSRNDARKRQNMLYIPFQPYSMVKLCILSISVNLLFKIHCIYSLLPLSYDLQSKWLSNFSYSFHIIQWRGIFFKLNYWKEINRKSFNLKRQKENKAFAKNNEVTYTSKTMRKEITRNLCGPIFIWTVHVACVNTCPPTHGRIRQTNKRNIIK